MAVAFQSPDEFREVMEKAFGLLSEQAGPALKETPTRFAFPDVELVANVRVDGDALAVDWSDEVAWEPRVRMTMSSGTANSFFQGTENVALAIGRRDIRTGGDVKAALALLPAAKPVFERYRALVESEYPHLVRK